MINKIKNKIKLVAVALSFFSIAHNSPLKASSSIFFPLSFLNKISFLNRFSSERQKILDNVTNVTHFVSVASVITFIFAPGIVTPAFMGGSLIGSYLLQRHSDANKLAKKIHDVDTNVKDVKNKVLFLQETANRIEMNTKKNGEKIEKVDENINNVNAGLIKRFEIADEQSKKYYEGSSARLDNIEQVQDKHTKILDDVRKEQEKIQEIAVKTQTDVQKLHAKYDFSTEEQREQMALLKKQGEKSKQRRRKDKQKLASLAEQQIRTQELVTETDKKVDDLGARAAKQEKNTEILVATTMGIMGALSNMHKNQEELLDDASKKHALLNLLLEKQKQSEDAQKAFELQTAEVLNANGAKLDILCNHLMKKPNNQSFDNVEDVSAASLLPDWQMQTGKRKK